MALEVLFVDPGVEFVGGYKGVDASETDVVAGAVIFFAEVTKTHYQNGPVLAEGVKLDGFAGVRPALE
jgi:hypothetical protein